jgi:hypothetical protein
VAAQRHDEVLMYEVPAIRFWDEAEAELSVQREVLFQAFLEL